MAEKTLITLTSPEGATLNTAGKYCDKDIEIVPNLQEKVATESGIVTADEGCSGLKSVDTTPVYEAGKKAEYDAFWDAYQQNGERKNYLSAFAGAGWGSFNVFPKYNLNAESAVEMFYHHAEEAGGHYDLVEHLGKQGITLDFSRCTAYYSAFAYACIRRIGVVNFSGIIDGSYALGNAFIGSYIVTIDKVIVSEKTKFPNSTFQNCKKLSDLTIEGTLGENGFNVQWSTLLTHDSLMSIINALKDYSEDTSGTDWLVTIGSENKAKLTEDEILIAENKGWRLA